MVLLTKFDAARGQIVDVLCKVSGRLEIKNADDRTPVRTRQAVLQIAEFKAARIKHQTTYRTAAS